MKPVNSLLLVLGLLFSVDRAAAGDDQRSDRYGDSLPPRAVARMGTVRFRHGTPIHEAAFVNNGREVATVSLDGTVCVWDTDTGKELQRFHSQSKIVDSVAISASARLLAIASPVAIEIWDVVAAANLHRILVEGNRVGRLQFSPNGETIAWSMTTKGPLATVVSVTKVANGDVLLQRSVPESRSYPKTEFGFSSDGTLLFVGDLGAESPTVEVWDAHRAETVQTISSGKSLIWNWTTTPYGNRVFLHTSDGLIGWDRLRGEQRFKLDRGLLPDWEPPNPVASDTLVLGSMDGTVFLRDEGQRTGQERSFRAHPGYMGAMALAPEAKTLATIGNLDDSDDHDDPPEIRLWELPAGRQLNAFPGASVPYTPWIGFSPDGRSLLELREGDTAFGCGTTEMPGTDYGDSYTALVQLRKIATGEIAVRREYSRESSMNAMFSEDSKYLASWTDRGALAVWEVETGTEVTRSAGHEGDVIKVLFAPDGESLVSFDVHSVVRVWQATTGAMRYELPVTERTVRDLALSDDGRYLATCETNDGWKDVVRLLELSTGRELLTLVRQFTPHFQADDGPRFHRIGFAGDGSLVIAGGAGKTLQAWRVDVAKPVRELAPAAEKGNAQPPSPRPTLSLERVATVQPIDRVERDGYFETEQVFSSGRHATYRLFDEDEPADGKYLVRAYDLAAGNPIFDVRTAGTNIVDGRERIAVSGDGTMLAHADPAGHVVRLRSQDGGVRELGGWSYAVDCVQFSPDGQWLATAAPDAAIPDRVFTNEFIPTSSRIQIWDVATGEKLLELPGHPGRITTLAFSPDGSKLASGSSDTTVLVWDLEDRKRSDQTR